MRAGPKKGHLGPKRAAPGGTGPSRTVGGLIRERPVFVNVGGCRGISSLKRRNWGEYIGFRGVFRGETAARPGHRNIGTLAIGNLTARWRKTHPRNQCTGEDQRRSCVRRAPTQRYQGGYSCQRPTTSRALQRRGPVARAGLVCPASFCC